MECKYRIKYQESEKFYGDIYKIQKLREDYITALAIPACITLIAIYICFRAGFFTGEQGSVPVFLVKFIIGIGLLFAAGQWYRKSFAYKGSLALADKQGQEMYAKRSRFGRINVTMEFYEDHFVSLAKVSKVNHGSEVEDSSYTYAEVRKMFETDELFAVTVIDRYQLQALIGIPKEALEENEIDEFRTWLQEKCTGVKKGFVKVG